LLLSRAWNRKERSSRSQITKIYGTFCSTQPVRFIILKTLTFLDATDNTFTIYLGSNKSDLAPLYDFVSYLEFCRYIGYKTTEDELILDGFDYAIDGQNEG